MMAVPYLIPYSLSSQYAGFVNDKVHFQSRHAKMDLEAKTGLNRRTNITSTAKGSRGSPVKEWGDHLDH